MNKITLAPVSKNNPEALKDYKQEVNQQGFHPWLWTGDINGKDKVGDYFGFLHQDQDIIEVTKVIQVLDKSVIRRGWSNYRNIHTLVCDPRFKSISFTQFKKDAGYKPNLVVNANKRLSWPY